MPITKTAAGIAPFADTDLRKEPVPGWGPYATAAGLGGAALGGLGYLSGLGQPRLARLGKAAIGGAVGAGLPLLVGGAMRAAMRGQNRHVDEARAMPVSGYTPRGSKERTALALLSRAAEVPMDRLSPEQKLDDLRLYANRREQLAGQAEHVLDIPMPLEEIHAMDTLREYLDYVRKYKGPDRYSYYRDRRNDPYDLDYEYNPPSKHSIYAQKMQLHPLTKTGAALTATQREALPGGDFCLPGRRYPIPDEAHARNALARVAQHGTPDEQARVRAKVHAKFPNIE